MTAIKPAPNKDVERILAPWRNNEGSDVGTINALRDYIETLIATIEAQRGALIDYNDQLRSACAVADRNGERTNWKTLRWCLHYTLAEHRETVNAARAAMPEIDTLLATIEAQRDALVEARNQLLLYYEKDDDRAGYRLTPKVVAQIEEALAPAQPDIPSDEYLNALQRKVDAEKPDNFKLTPIVPAQAKGDMP